MDFLNLDPDKNFNLKYISTVSANVDRSEVIEEKKSDGTESTSKHTKCQKGLGVKLRFLMLGVLIAISSLMICTSIYQIGNNHDVIVKSQHDGKIQCQHSHMDQNSDSIFGDIIDFDSWNSLFNKLIAKTADAQEIEEPIKPANTMDVSKEKAYATLVIRADIDGTNSSTTSTPSTTSTSISSTSTSSSSLLITTSSSSSSFSSFTPSTSSSLSSESTSFSTFTVSDLTSTTFTSSSSSSVVSSTSSSPTSSSSSEVPTTTSSSDGTAIIINTTTQTEAPSQKTLTTTSANTANPTLSTENQASNKGLSSKNKKIVIGCVVGILGGLLFLTALVFAYFRFYKPKKDERYVNSEGLWVTRNGNPDEKLNSALNSPKANRASQSASTWRFWKNNDLESGGGKSPRLDSNSLHDEDQYDYQAATSPTNRYANNAY